METLKYLRDKAASIWSTVWTWVAVHPKTTIIISAGIVIAALARKY